MRAKTPSGGQIALRRTGAMQFQITSRGKDYAGMSKSKIEIEMEESMGQILIKDGMIIEKRHFNNLKLKEYLKDFANMLFDI